MNNWPHSRLKYRAGIFQLPSSSKHSCSVAAVWQVGANVGDLVVGDNVGEFVGDWVGVNVGVDVGYFVGGNDGDCVVGDVVGEFVVGEFEGVDVGEIVGAVVGSFDKVVVFVVKMVLIIFLRMLLLFLGCVIGGGDEGDSKNMDGILVIEIKE